MRRINLAWRLLVVAVVDVLNPLFLIALALFFSAGYTLTLLMPVNIAHWQALLIISLLVSLAGLGTRAVIWWRKDPAETQRFSWRVILPLLPLLIFAPLFTGELTEPYLQIRHHGDIHVGYIHQLMHSATPVENIFVPGQPAKYYWLYHALLAALVQLTGLPPPFVASLLNIAAILSSLLWIGRTLLRFRVASSGTLYLGCAAILVYCAVNLHGPITFLAVLQEKAEAVINLADTVSQAADADHRLSSTMGKVMNFTSMTLALLAFAAALYVCVSAAQGRLRRLNLVLATACSCVGLAVQGLAAVYMGVALFGGLALAAALAWMMRPGRLTRLRSCAVSQLAELGPGYLLGWLALSLTLALPLLGYTLSLSSGSGLRLELILPDSPNVRMQTAALVLLLPFFPLHGVYALRCRRVDQIFITTSSALCFLLTAALWLPDENQYKGVYFLAMTMALAALLLLQAMRDSGTWQWRLIAHTIAFALIALALVKIVIVTRHYDRLATLEAWTYDGRNINFGPAHGEIMLADALYWVRENTAQDAIVVLPLGVYKYAHLAHERMVYVRQEQDFHADHLAAYHRRVDRLARFFSDDDADPELLTEMSLELPGRALYAVVKPDEVSQATMLRRGAVLVFDGTAHVYRLNPD